MKIFIGISETSGFCTRLQKGFEKNGIPCCFAQLFYHRHLYNIKSDRFIFRLARKINKKVRDGSNLTFCFYGIKLLVFIWSLIFYDVFIFPGYSHFGLNYLRILKILHKKIIFIGLGSFTRLPYCNGKYVKGSRERKPYTDQQLLVELRQKKEQIKQIEKYADIILEFPQQAQLIKKNYISMTNIGLPITIEVKKEEASKKPNGIVRILHVATEIGCRGTKEFRSIINKLKKKYPIEYIQLTGVPNKKVIDEIQKCDFIIDELYSDTPMATFAAEAGYFGKPAIVCGYFSKLYKNYYTPTPPPTLYVMPEHAEDAIIKLIEDAAFRRNLGEKARKYVHEQLDSSIVAKKIENVIRGDFPKEWIVNAAEVGYLYGYGLSKEEIAKKIQSMAKKFGPEALLIKGKKPLNKNIMELVKNGDKENDWNSKA